MSETLSLWLFGTVITILTIVIGGLVTALWAHVGHCKDLAASVARIDTNLERVMRDIGDHESGLRGHVHTVAKFVDAVEKRLYVIERQEDRR